MQGQLHIDLKQIREGLHDLHKFLFIDDLERLLDVRLHKVEKLSESFLNFSSRSGVIIDIVI